MEISENHQLISTTIQAQQLLGFANISDFSNISNIVASSIFIYTSPNIFNRFLIITRIASFP